ncbi:hypothetical protein BDV59DRAFT_32830 [Aspergillus ambiguus]|uniref:uncharacterized protein n=1 Tax=Aspergillus ambiguus TaxID=176160 RepID=UPI003CCDFA43
MRWEDADDGGWKEKKISESVSRCGLRLSADLANHVVEVTWSGEKFRRYLFFSSSSSRYLTSSLPLSLSSICLLFHNISLLLLSPSHPSDLYSILSTTALHPLSGLICTYRSYHSLTISSLIPATHLMEILGPSFPGWSATCQYIYHRSPILTVFI